MYAPYRIKPGLQITTPQMRRLGFSVLNPNAKVMWDIGAGSGQCAIRWKLENPNCETYAIERDADCIADIVYNKDQQGAHGVIVVHRDATATLKDLPRPDAIYLGCLGQNEVNLAAKMWDWLAPGGTVVTFAMDEQGVEHVAEMMEAKIGIVRVVHPEPRSRNTRMWAATKPLE